MLKRRTNHSRQGAILRGGALAIFLAIGLPVAARMGPPPPSRSVDPSTMGTSQILAVPSIDQAKRIEADEQVTDPAPFKFADPYEVVITPATHGTWVVLPDGTELWRLTIRAPGATDLNFGFTHYQLPAGAKLYIYSTGDGYYQGPYTEADNKKHGQLWTPVVPGEEATIELYLPPGTAGQEQLALSSVNRGYRDLFKRGPSVKQGSCNNDVICPEADPWRSEIRAVGLYTLNGTWTCTGTLIMDAQNSFRNFFITANHCDVSTANDQSMVVYWNFESPVCGELDGGSLADNQLGATLRASKSDVDMALLELDDHPDPSFNVYYAGWSRSGSAPQAAVGIHHPNTDEKAISFDNDPLETVNSCIETGGKSTHWQVGAWEDGTTESGSSGSGLWDANTHLLVGFLSGGEASCSNPNGADCYGKFSVAWDDSGGSPATRLKDWLDPCDTGVFSVSGSNPGTPVTQLPKPLLLTPTGEVAYAAGSTILIQWNTNGAPPDAQVVLEYTDLCSGDPPPVFSDDVEGGVNGWATSHGTGSGDWSQVVTDSYSPVTSWFAANVGSVSDQYLVSPGILIGTGQNLSFWHAYDLETKFDGGVVEISSAGASGPWTDLGSRMTQNGYVTTISTNYSSPIGGREAFTGTSPGFIRTLVDLADFSGQTVHFRFREANDATVSQAGWWVDDIEIFDALQTWKSIATAAPGANSFLWNSPPIPGADYCLRLQYTSCDRPDSDSCQGGVFELTLGTLDTDGDGIPDPWERAYGLNPSISNAPTDDFDGDFVPDVEEYLADTAANDSNVFFRATQIQIQSPPEVFFDSSTGRIYTLQYLDDMLIPLWSNVSGAVEQAGVGGPDSLSDTNAAVPFRAYRIRVGPP